MNCVAITQQHILPAIHQFDITYPDTNDYKCWLQRGNYRWAVRHNGKLYPCKWLVVRAMGWDETQTPEIHTHEAVRVLMRCGFEVIPRP